MEECAWWAEEDAASIQSNRGASQSTPEREVVGGLEFRLGHLEGRGPVRSPEGVAQEAVGSIGLELRRETLGG